VEVGSVVGSSDTVVVLEVMKMEQLVKAGVTGRLSLLTVAVGDAVAPGDHLATIDVDEGAVEVVPEVGSVDLSSLTEVDERHRLGLDEARPEEVDKRHRRGHRTARENVADLTTDFVEYGPLAIAAQRGRRELDDLIRRTPADGLIGGIGRIATDTNGDDRAIVVSYDYTVLAGTQGMQNHRKKDRLFTLAADTALPVVLFAEGGGGRPGDVDWPGASILDVPAFRLFAEIPGPTIGINNGYCFAGNAALLGQCDVIVSTRDANLGMGGPAMIEGGGLGSFAPTEIGPTEVQLGNGVIDVGVEDDAEAVAVARTLVGFTRGVSAEGVAPDPSLLRTIVPANRRQLYEMRGVIDALVDDGSFLELRRESAPAAITGFGRVEGRPFGIIANDPTHLAGAIDHDAATSFSSHIRLCDRWGLPILSLCDTPGFMVGPDVEAEGLVRSAGNLFRTAAEVSVPFGTVVTRRGYGLGAQAMAAGGFHEPRFTVAWPNSEFGPMGLEGAVKLGFSKELEAIDDSAEREAEMNRRVEEMYEIGRGLNVATHFEIDDIIDPADTRRWILTGLL
jgi:acetyl-CoA carboxylase carboxyltransferase component